MNHLKHAVGSLESILESERIYLASAIEEHSANMKEALATLSPDKAEKAVESISKESFYYLRTWSPSIVGRGESQVVLSLGKYLVAKTLVYNKLQNYYVLSSSRVYPEHLEETTKNLQALGLQVPPYVLLGVEITPKDWKVTEQGRNFKITPDLRGDGHSIKEATAAVFDSLINGNSLRDELEHYESKLLSMYRENGHVRKVGQEYSFSVNGHLTQYGPEEAI
ncbi:MAG: hypothetical protein AABX59_01870, partial [Nanoarchaeota archaeon]